MSTSLVASVSGLSTGSVVHNSFMLLSFDDVEIRRVKTTMVFVSFASCVVMS